MALAVFVYRLTGDKRFQKARNHLMVLASYPYGGRSSPEYHGARSKWATQIVRHMAFCYDWLYDELNEAGRKQLRAAIDWRLRAVYLQKNSWMRGKNIAQSGVAVFASSHPYENLNWAMPAVILTAGDSAVASELLPLCLNYLTGVTAAHGPDEAWNEGMSYGSAKSYAMLRASMCAAIALPELQVAENPVYDRLLEWFSHLTPIGLERHSFGEYASGVDTRRATILRVTRALTWLTQDGRGRERWLALAKEVGDNVRTTPHLHRWSYSPWVELLGATYFATPEPKKNGTAMLFPDAGWAFALSGSIANRKKFDNGSGMLFQCRPMGGYSHSYRAEGDFVWHAYGQTVGTSGGRMAYPDPHSRDSMSHNVIMVNGIGQRWGPFDDYRTGWWKPGYPFHGRMIAWRERPGFVHWVGDATHAYQSIPDLLRWHRHVVFVAGKWFAIYDDLAMRPGADPARFSWLYHIYPDLQIARDEKGIGFSYQMENVHARVAMGNPAEELEFVDMRDIDGFKNPLTGFDYQPVRVKALRMKGRDDRKAGWMAHNIWITNKEPAAQYAFLTALTAWREGEKAPKVDFDRTRKVTVTMSDGEARSVSFAEGVAGDVTVDVGTIRAHAIATDPGVLPPSDPRGMHATVAAGGKTVDAEWLLSERFEDGPVTLARWKTEGNAEVSALNGRLLVRPVGSAGGDVGSVVWFRPEIPAGSIVRMILDAKSGGDSPELVLMWGAREPTGVPLRFTRAGRAKDYADVFHAEAALPTGRREDAGYPSGGRQGGFGPRQREAGGREARRRQARSLRFPRAQRGDALRRGPRRSAALGASGGATGRLEKRGGAIGGHDPIGRFQSGSCLPDCVSSDHRGDTTRSRPLRGLRFRVASPDSRLS